MAAIGARKQAGQLVVGFAAETEDLIANARRKLFSKHADLIVANDVTMEGAGFDVDTNIVTLVRAEGEEALPLLSKRGGRRSPSRRDNSDSAVYACAETPAHDDRRSAAMIADSPRSQTDQTCH